MAQMSVEVPGELVCPVRETVVLLYGATAESLHFALRARAEGGGPLDEVHRHRARLAQFDGLLDQLGWSPGEPAKGVELTACGEILHDVLYGALIDAGERLALACGADRRGELRLQSVAWAARQVIALDRLLRRVRG